MRLAENFEVFDPWKPWLLALMISAHCIKNTQIYKHDHRVAIKVDTDDYHVEKQQCISTHKPSGTALKSLVCLLSGLVFFIPFQACCSKTEDLELMLCAGPKMTVQDIYGT